MNHFIDEHVVFVERIDIVLEFLAFFGNSRLIQERNTLLV